MTAIAIHISSLFRATRWAGVAAVLTLGITATKSTQPATSAPSVATPAVSTPAATPAKPVHHWYQLGAASWYGTYLQGRTTASGESYNMYDLTCAHRSLPFGSLVRVTNLRNRRTIIVRVNDRGPVPDGRIVDLSYAAANVLGLHGVAKVRLELLPTVAQLHWPETIGK